MIETLEAPAGPGRRAAGAPAGSTARRLGLALLALGWPALVRAQLGDKLSEGPQVPLPAARQLVVEAPLTAEEEGRTFQLPNGFRADLVAAEPLVHDPVAAAYDLEGNLWVVEMSQYNAGLITDHSPLADGHTSTPPSKVVRLESSLHDGRYDRRTVWLDHGLNYPRGIMVMRDGFLIADPPKLWFARDLHGTGKCDDLQLAADNYGIPGGYQESGSLLWGRDNLVHDVAFAYDYRYAHGKLERLPVLVRGQFGISQDDYGRFYFSLNSDQLRSDLYSPFYNVRNPNVTELPWADVQIAKDQEVWPSHPTPAVNRGYHPGVLGKSTGGLREDGTLLEFTAACSGFIYRGANFPAQFYGNAFVPEPSGNLIKRNLLLEAQGQITAVNAYEGREFMASTDTRFRPVALVNAPDGAMLVVDLYRGFIEDFQWVTTYLRDQTLGRGLQRPMFGQGRLWKVTYEGGPLETKTPDLRRLSDDSLAGLLAHPDAWWREAAQQELVEREAKDAAPALEALALRGESVATRVSALWTLDGLAATSPRLLAAALRDPSPKVRSAAVRLHERWLGGADEQQALGQLAPVLRDPAPEVTVQLALTLGAARSEAVLDLMGQVLLLDGAHPYVASAIATGLHGRELEFFRRMAGQAERFGPTPEATTELRLLSTAIVRQGDAGQVRDLIARIGDDARAPDWVRLAVLKGFEPLYQPAFRRAIGPANVTQSAELAPLVASSDPAVKAAAAGLSARLANIEEQARERERVQRPLTPDEQRLYDEGKVTYLICAACHQANGGGLANLAPSLVDSYWVSANPEVLVRIILNGKEGTPGFPGSMPAIGNSFTDEQIAAVLTYVRNSWGLHAGAVSLATVAKSRKENGARVSDWTDALLRALEFDLAGGWKNPPAP
jgi:mono/diheme cytochrome c family protein